MPIFGRVGTSPRSQFPSVGQISNDVEVACGSSALWICHGSTHLGSVDEYLDDFLDARRRLEDGVPLKELFASGERGQLCSPSFLPASRGDIGVNSPEPVFTACT